MRTFVIASSVVGLLLSGCQSRTGSGLHDATSAPGGMVMIPGGTFRMGTDDGMPDEAPAHDVTVKPFWMDVHEVTVAEFERFVHATK